MEIPPVSNVSTFSQQNPQQADVSDLDGQTSVASQAICLAEIRLDSTLQVREKTSAARVRQYAAHMKDGIELPPITVFHDHQSFWLGDGKHRVLAAQANGYHTIQTEVRQGTERDAFLYGLAINAAHGWTLSSKEKRAAIDLMLQDPEWGTWGDREIARQCGTTHPTVAERRKLVSGKSYQIGQTGMRKYKRGDQTFIMDTTNIGHRSPSTDRSEAMTEASSMGENDQTVEPDASEEVDRPRHIDAVYCDEDELLKDSPNITARNENLDPGPDGSNSGVQPGPKDAASDELPETQESPALLPALHSLLEMFEGGISDFRQRYACNEPVAEEVLSNLEGELQRNRYILKTHSQRLSSDSAERDVEEIITPEQPDSLGGNVPQNPDVEMPTDHQTQNRISTSDGSEWNTTESPQYPKVELNHEMQPSDRLNTRQAAQLVGMPLERFKALEKSGTTPCAFHKDGPQYYSDDLFRWKKSKGDNWPSLVRGSQELPVFGGDNGLEKKAS